MTKRMRHIDKFGAVAHVMYFCIFSVAERERSALFEVDRQAVTLGATAKSRG